MNNKAFDNFMNQDFKGLSDWFSTLNPYEFTFIATIIGSAIAPLLNIHQQVALGNFFEQVGQTLETIGAQGNLNQIYLASQQNPDFASDISDIKVQLERLKRKIDN